MNSKDSKHNYDLEITFSIIIPHKNSPSLLSRCLDSIPTGEDIEVIVVDDNSSSEIVDFTNFPGKEEPGTTVVLTKDSRGAGYARNIGLERARGKWMIFADADDFFLPQFSSKLYQYVDSENDIIFFNIQSENNQGDNYKKYVENYVADSSTSIVDLKYRTWSPWAKMYSKKFIDNTNVKFEERMVGNDCFFILNLNYRAQAITVDRTPIYTHTFNPTGLSHGNTKNLFFAVERMKLFIWRHKFFNSIGQEELTTGAGIYGSLRGIYRKFGFFASLKASLIAVNSRANFINPILYKIRQVK